MFFFFPRSLLFVLKLLSPEIPNSSRTGKVLVMKTFLDWGGQWWGRQHEGVARLQRSADCPKCPTDFQTVAHIHAYFIGIWPV